MKPEEKMLHQLMNQKTLMHHIDRALATIDKFEHSHIKSTKLPVHGIGAGRYIYLADLLAVRKELFDYAEQLAKQLDTTVATAEMEIQ